MKNSKLAEGIPVIPHRASLRLTIFTSITAFIIQLIIKVRQRQSIRRQGRVETNQPVTDPVHESRHSSSTRTAGQICESMVEDEGDCFGSDEFNYDRDGGSGGAGHRSSGNNMRYMDDRSNCRKK